MELRAIHGCTQHHDRVRGRIARVDEVLRHNVHLGVDWREYPSPLNRQ